MSVGLVVFEILPELADRISAYCHAGSLIVQAVCVRRVPWCLVALSALLSAIFPRYLIALRTTSIFFLFHLFVNSDPKLGEVVRLASRTISLTGWVFLITVTYAWVFVLIFTLLLDFKSTSTWLFLKPGEPGFFENAKYFGPATQSLVSFIQVITGDHYMSHIVRPLVDVYPPIILFFLSVKIVGTFGLLFGALGLCLREQMAILKRREPNHDKQTLYIQLKIQGLVNQINRLNKLLTDMQTVSQRIALFNNYHK